MLAQSNPPFEAAAPRVARRRTALWVAIALAVACGTLWAVYPLRGANGRLDAVPRSGPGFSSADVTLNPAELQVLGRVDLIHRKYQLGQHAFYATLIDGTKDRHAVHDPRYCFQGAGWTVLAEEQLPLPGGAARLVRAKHADREVQALFWFSDGARRYTSVLQYWWQTTLRRMSLGRLGGEPVLVVLQSFGPDQPDWRTLAPEVLHKLRL